MWEKQQNRMNADGLPHTRQTNPTQCFKITNNEQWIVAKGPNPPLQTEKGPDAHLQNDETHPPSHPGQAATSRKRPSQKQTINAQSTPLWEQEGGQRMIAEAQTTRATSTSMDLVLRSGKKMELLLRQTLIQTQFASLKRVKPCQGLGWQATSVSGWLSRDWHTVLKNG
jgi:hypothetical protein